MYINYCVSIISGLVDITLCVLLKFNYYLNGFICAHNDWYVLIMTTMPNSGGKAAPYKSWSIAFPTIFIKKIRKITSWFWPNNWGKTKFKQYDIAKQRLFLFISGACFIIIRSILALFIVATLLCTYIKGILREIYNEM